jgi:hypothetical protein
MKNTCTQACPPSMWSATTSASLTVRGLMPCAVCTWVSALMRSRSARALVLHGLGRLLHLAGERLLDLGGLARQEARGVEDLVGVVVLGDQAHAGAEQRLIW